MREHVDLGVCIALILITDHAAMLQGEEPQDMEVCTQLSLRCLESVVARPALFRLQPASFAMLVDWSWAADCLLARFVFGITHHDFQHEAFRYSDKIGSRCHPCKPATCTVDFHIHGSSALQIAEQVYRSLK